LATGTRKTPTDPTDQGTEKAAPQFSVIRERRHCYFS